MLQQTDQVKLMTLLPDKPSPDALPPHDEAFTKWAHEKFGHLGVDGTYRRTRSWDVVQQGAICKLSKARNLLGSLRGSSSKARQAAGG